METSSIARDDTPGPAKWVLLLIVALLVAIPGVARTLVDSRYTLLKSFPTGLEQLQEHDYDAFGASFVPLTRLDRIDRPGPAFTVYGIRDARSSAH